jgi:hypothetical protein
MLRCLLECEGGRERRLATELYYQRAAEAGLAQAALVLASTYDPDELGSPARGRDAT